MLVHFQSTNPDQRKVHQVVECLKNDGVIIFPTDTVYAFGCSLHSAKAIEKIAKLKGLRADNANLSLVCADLSELALYCKPLDNHIFRMMKRVLPGPYTFILEANRNIPKFFSGRKKTIGIRVPDSPYAKLIAEQLGHPLVASSVHDDDDILEYTTDPELIHEKYEAKVDMVIDGGQGGLLASTVVDCSNGSIQIIREGKGEVESIF